MLYLYDPTTNLLKETTYDYLEKLTGIKKSTLASYKSKKLKITSINSYITDENVTLVQRRAWYAREIYHNEIWKPIEGTNKEYLVSNYGRFKKKLERYHKLILPFDRHNNGKLQVKLTIKGKYAAYMIADIVAEHFLGKPKPGMVVHHKNLIKSDNYFENLMYITKEELARKRAGLAKGKPIVQLDKDTGEILGEYRSSVEAAKHCFLSRQAILDCCHHKSKTSGGFIFMFEKEYEATYKNQVS